MHADVRGYPMVGFSILDFHYCNVRPVMAGFPASVYFTAYIGCIFVVLKKVNTYPLTRGRSQIICNRSFLVSRLTRAHKHIQGGGSGEETID